MENGRIKSEKILTSPELRLAELAMIKAVLFDLFDTLLLIEKRKGYNFLKKSGQGGDVASGLVKMHEYLVSKGVNASFDEFYQAYVEARDALYAKVASFEEPHFNVRVIDTLKKLGFNNDISSAMVTGATHVFYEEFMKYVKIDEYTLSVIQQLKGKYKLGIISNFAIPECAFELLSLHGLDKLFDLIIISGAVNKRKPSPEIFKDALKTLGVSASEAAFVGDTADADVGGPKAVGMYSIYLKRRIEEDLEKYHPDFVIESLGDLPIVLNRN